MKYQSQKLPKNAIEIVVTLPWNEVDQTSLKMLDELVQNAEIKGFRKGKAPKDLILKNLDKKSFQEEVLGKLIKDTYPQIVKELNLLPIAMPRIEIISQEENKDWSYKITICQAPEIDLGQYKTELEKKNAKDKIWLPGQEIKKGEEDKNKKLSNNLAHLLESINFELSDILVEDETTKLLSELLEEIKKLGLNLEQYLASTHKTIEQLRDEYKKKAQSSLKMEFILSKVADQEKISVTDEEIQKAINEVKEDTLREQLKTSSYQLASLIRRQKTLDFIANL